MFDESKLEESKLFSGGVDYFDIDWDTYNGGKGLTESQATAKKQYYAEEGYKCRSIKSEGRYMFYIYHKATPEIWEKTRDFLDGRRKTRPNDTAIMNKYKKQKKSSEVKRSSQQKR
jgi:hypothetical protein